ncbi:MAG: response regulator [Paludibacter sp.]|nr:response regulator [Paludibacter sp.]
MIEISNFDWHNYTILIADDDEMNYILLTFMLEETTVSIVRAENGAEAVDLCKSDKKIDLILMDVKMPIMDGIDATRAIKSFRPNLPIIIQSAHILEEVKQNCFAAGCDNFFDKPFDENIFYNVIDSHLKKNS